MPKYFAPSVMIATGALSDWAMPWNPGGSCVTLSPCEAQTVSEPGRPFSRGLPASVRLRIACPYSRSPEGSTRPPRVCVSSCIP